MKKLRKYVPELILFVFAVLFLLTKNPSSEWDRVIVSDGKGYYAYLTSLFIYHDTDYGFIDQYEAEYFPPGRELYKDFRVETDKGIVNKYFPGIAVLWLPFFGAGHVTALLFGFPADGYSMPYQLAIAFAALFYFWLALLILRRILRFYTKDETAIALTLIAVALATNLIYYTVNAGSQVHVYNFFLINAFVYSVLLASKQGKPAFYVSAAFLLGMIIISRPQNGLIILALPFILGNRADFLLFFQRIFTKVRFFLPSAVALLLPLLIPLTYWYVKTGQLLVYSYGNETYNLAKPHLLSFLLSFEKGWWIYTPIAAFALLGFIYLLKKNKWQFFSLSAFLFFIVYFMSSWWTWTYTSFVSQRVMIDYYVFVAILLIFIFNWAGNKKKRIILPLILMGFITLNLLQHFQHLLGVYPAGPPTAKTYFSNFLSLSKGTTFMIPENEIVGRQNYTADFEINSSLFKVNSFEFSSICHSGKRALLLDTNDSDRPIFIRGMSDYKEAQPIILKIGGWYNPQTVDSSLSIEVAIGTFKSKYALSHHNVMPGLKSGKWKYAEMAVYLPYIRSVSDSLFINFQNLSKGKVLLDDVQVEFLKMKASDRHDWIIAANDDVDSASLYHIDLEKPLEAPWGNQATVTEDESFSGKKSSRILASSPYSVVFEKELDTLGKGDGYFRICSRILNANKAEVLLVFDFSSNGKSVFYKTYPVNSGGNNNNWRLSEIFREFPVARFKADKVKIYYWYIKGENPVYVDDVQVDIVKYKKMQRTRQTKFAGSMNSETLRTVCYDFEMNSPAESGLTYEVDNAYSGSNVCIVNARQPYSSSIWLSLSEIKKNSDAFMHITSQVYSDQYTTGATLVADFKHNGKTVFYAPLYLKGQTIKGQWNPVEFGVNLPNTIASNDSVLIYIYLPEGDEELMIDNFCVSIKKPVK